jgi:hypothetical protein
VTLIFDDRSTLQGNPGLHVFIVGVSRYEHLPGGGGTPTNNGFGMQQLNSTALTAFKIYQWLMNHKTQLPLPIATIRLLLSPSPLELNVEPAMAGLADPATRTNFTATAHAWRDDARASDDNMTWFYFAGHGVQRKKDDAVMLLEDFGAPADGPLTNAVAIENFFNGMAPPADLTRKIAQKQLYFIDACRIAPNQFNIYDWLNVPDIWGVEKSGRDDRYGPIFFAAVPGTKAYARQGEQTIFGEALTNCLDGIAGEPMEEDAQGQVNWQVTVYSLIRVLVAEIEELNKRFALDQDCTPGGLFKDLTVTYLNAAPQVDVSVEIDPTIALPHIALKVSDYSGNVVLDPPPPLTPHPFQQPLPAGLYTFSAEVASPPIPPSPPLVKFSRTLQVMPPRRTWKAKVSK